MISAKPSRHFVLATRGSALALAQTQRVLELCQQTFPRCQFEIQIIKTTGDKLQAASLAHSDPGLPKGLFTKELETALLEQAADLAVHSLKDLPTELPAGLQLGAVLKRADVRDVLLYRSATAVRLQLEAEARQPHEWHPGDPELRGFKSGLRINDLPIGATVATSSTRRQAQLQARRPDLHLVPMRGNVGTRLRKLQQQPELDALILAAAGLERLDVRFEPRGRLTVLPGSPLAIETSEEELPHGLLATRLDPEEMIPCVAQGAIGLETRQPDERVAPLCEALNHFLTFQCVTAERAFLRQMGGGCHSPVAAYARILGHRLVMKAVSFRAGPAQHGEIAGSPRAAEELGRQLAEDLQRREGIGPQP